MSARTYAQGLKDGTDNGRIITAGESDWPLMKLSLPIPGERDDRTDWLHGFADGLRWAAEQATKQARLEEA